MNTAHPDVETLADLAEGLLEPAHTSLVDAHVDACTDCAQLLAAVRGVPSLLAELPAPALPPGVAARIEAALAAESEQRLGRSTADTPTEGTVSALLPQAGGRRLDRHPRWRNLAVAAAAAVVVVGGTAVVVPRLGDTARTTADSSAGQADRAPEAAAAGRAAAGAADRPHRFRTGANADAKSGEAPWTRLDHERYRRLDGADGATTLETPRRAAALGTGASTGLNAGMPAS